MKKIFLFLLLTFCLASIAVNAQPQIAGSAPQNKGMAVNENVFDNKNVESGLMVTVNSMTPTTQHMLNNAAQKYRIRDRSLMAIGGAMLAGGVSAVINVISTEVVNLTKIRSNQKKEWLQMRQNECMFVDSLASVDGQSDFYAKQSAYGPLDPTDMNFDGITLRATRHGEDVLKMVCHIDTSRIKHIFLHSKFYLVVDTIQLYPYRSYLPNFSANKIREPQSADKELTDYWNTVSKFSFDDTQNLNIKVRMDISSSWINEMVQIQKDVTLGSFTLNLSINKNQINEEGLYSYVRSEALAKHQETVDITGECFVIPRSYMPVSASEPSWGTGEYKMKVMLTESANYNGNSSRARDWHHDYKMMKRLKGQHGNEYITNVLSTFRENANTIIKATYTPAITSINNAVTMKLAGSSTMQSQGVSMEGAGGQAATGMQSGLSGQPGQLLP